MPIEPWVETPDADMASLHATEARRWRDTLHWAYEDTRRQLEHARTGGLVPGFVARDASGHPRGWTFFARLGDELQVGALTAATPEVTSQLVGRVLASREASTASRAMVFGFADAPDADAELRAAGFAVGGYRYLARDVTPADLDAAPPPGQRGWRDGDLAAAARLLQAAYPAVDPLRPFATTGQAEEWCTYLTRLTSTTGCGVFMPALSVVHPGRASLDAVAIVTQVAPDTVHLAQVAVGAAMRGRGLAAGMVRGSLAAAARAGAARMTLLVGESNAAARRLYARLGFEERATFLSASRRGPSVSPADRAARRAPAPG